MENVQERGEPRQGSVNAVDNIYDFDKARKIQTRDSMSVLRSANILTNCNSIGEHPETDLERSTDASLDRGGVISDG